MNERILELADKAVEDMPSGPWNIPDEFCKKFAELIVRECIGVVENLSPGYADYRNQIEDAFRRDCVEKVKEHFGVE
jgi:hypothetical protein